MKRIALDIDGVLADFSSGIIKAAGEMGHSHLFPSSPSDVMSWGISNDFALVWDKVKDDSSFWLNLPAIPNPPFDFEVTAYITARPLSSHLSTIKWLRANGFPEPTECVCTVRSPELKIQELKEMKIDVFVDDKIDTILAVQAAGINGILYYAPYQRGHSHGLNPIYSLGELNERINGS